jgi:hypothetical protein
MTLNRAGFGRSDITPSLDIPHAGWGAQSHLLADGVHRPLYVEVLLLEYATEQGLERHALVSFDLVGLYGIEEAIAAKVAVAIDAPPDHVRVSVTHNHANPVMWENWIGGRLEEVQRYRANLSGAAAGAARAAWLDLQPVRLGSSRGRCDIGRNRRQRILESDGRERVIVGRNDHGSNDPELLVVRLDKLDGSPHAAILGFTCHPTTLGPDNRLHSPDYPGVAKAIFENATGARALFVQGAAGNVGPRFGFVGDVAVVEQLGLELGLAAASVHSTIDTRAVELCYQRPRESGATLAVWTEEPLVRPAEVVRALRRSVELPLRPQPPLAEAEENYRHWQAELARVHRERQAAEVIERTMFQARRAQMGVTRAKTYGGHDRIGLTLTGLRLGDCAIIGCNGEPFVEIGLAIKAASPFTHTFFGGYTGPALGYIPWPSAFDEGGYEVETTPYTAEAAPLLVDAALGLLRELA